MKKFFKYAFAMLAMTAMALCVASCSKDDDDDEGPGKVGISYDDLYDKMWVVNKEKYEWIDEETGKKQTGTMTSQELLEEEGIAVEIGMVMVFEKVWESSRFVYVKRYYKVGVGGSWSEWHYGVIDKMDSNWYGCGNKLYDESELLSNIDRVKEISLYYTLSSVSSSKLVWIMNEEDGSIVEITYTPQSSWHGKTMQQIIDGCSEYNGSYQD